MGYVDDNGETNINQAILRTQWIGVREKSPSQTMVSTIKNQADGSISSPYGSKHCLRKYLTHLNPLNHSPVVLPEKVRLDP